MSDRYILNEAGEPVDEPDLLKWARWFEHGGNRKIARDEMPSGAVVSTVFLGLDHSFSGGPPVLWETMIFGGEHDDYQERHTSRAEALEGHKRAVELASGQVADAPTVV